MIKVCGIRRAEDIEYVNSLKPEYIGFIFAESKRQISKKDAKKLKQILDKEIKTVGVFVNEDIDDIIDISVDVGLDVIQLHGDEDQTYIDNIKKNLKDLNKNIEIWKVIRVKSQDSLKLVKSLNVDGILLDTYSQKAYGGLGESFNWNMVRGLKLDSKLILAGGLDADNVKYAKSVVNPNIIDVSSGVETDGFKDYEKMKIFIERGR